MATFICGRCGFVAFSEVPDNCPVCGAPKQAFKLDNNAIKKPGDPKNLNDLEKKHIPVVNVKQQCSLAGGCVDVSIKVGEILHVMEARHFIAHIDVYIDYKFAARYHLAPEKLNPALGIHLKVDSGKLLALENCNIHGRWIAETGI